MRLRTVTSLLALLPFLCTACGSTNSTVAPTAPTATAAATIVIAIPATAAQSARAVEQATPTSTPTTPTPLTIGSTATPMPLPTRATQTPPPVSPTAHLAAPTATATVARTATAVSTATTAATATTAVTVATANRAKVTRVPASAPKQTVGSPTDGLTLLNIRTGDHDGFTRIVFDVARQDGSAAPAPRAQLWTEDGAIVLLITGIRNDFYGDSLGAREQAIGMGAVQSLYRVPTRDDAAVAYGISVRTTTKVTLGTTTAPTRLILDIMDE